MELHARLFGTIEWRTAAYNVPFNVQELMSKPVSSIKFKFRNPVACLIGMLERGPLSGDPRNMAFHPEPSIYYDDFAHGARIERIYAKLPHNAYALTCVLYFDR
jgi:hypothetical protein